MKKFVRITMLLAAAFAAGAMNAAAGTGGQASLNVPFNPKVMSYSATVSHDVTEITVVARAQQSGATVTVNGGDPDTPVRLAVGENTITIVVTAEDRKTRLTYTVTVTRAAADADGGPDPQVAGYTVPEALVRTVRRYYEMNRNNPGGGENWFRVLIAFGAETHATLRPYTVAEAEESVKVWSGWQPVLDALRKIEAANAPAVPAVSLSAAPNPVAEGSAVRVTATLSAALAGDVTVPLAVTRGTSEDGDHGTLAGILIPAGAVSATASITTADDADADDETFTVALGTLPSAVSAGDTTSVEVTITDDDTSQPQVAGYTVPEALVRTVRRYYEMNRNSPGGGENWFRVLIAFGAETHATLRPYTVAEAEESVKVWSGWQPVLDALRQIEAANAPAVPAVSLSAAPNPVAEGAAVRVTATLSSALAGDVTVPVAVTRGTSEAGDHGTLAGILIPAGAVSATGTITTADDADADDETFTVALGTLPPEVSAGSASSVAVTVADDDESRPQVQDPPAAPAVTIAAGSGVTEGGSAGFTLTANPAPAQDLAVSVTVSQQGAFTEASALGARTVTIPAGQTTASFTVATVDDAADEADGAVVATVGAGSGYTAGETASASVAVADDDVLAVTIAAGPAVTEGGSARFTLTAAPAPAQDLGVSVTVSQQGAFADASALGPRTVTIPAGKTEATFTVPTVNDAADEPDGGIVAAVGAGSGYTVGETARASVAVADDDVSPPQVTAKRAMAVEGRDDAVVFRVRLSHAGTAAVSVDWATADGAGPWLRTAPARAGADYVASSGTVTFAAGETERTFRVPILDDAVDEGTEHFLVRFSNPRGATLAAGARETQGLIRNNDHLQSMWLSRFGRTVGSQVADAVSGRLEGRLAPGAHATVAGSPVDLAGAESGKAMTDVLTALAMAYGPREAEAEGPLARGADGLLPDAPGTLAARSLTGRDVLLGSAFHVAPEGGRGPAVWGRVSRGGFDGVHADGTGRTDVNGAVTTATFGADMTRGRMLAGLAVSLSDGGGAFDQPDVDSGSVSSRMTTASPYARLRVTDRVTAWGLAGLGTGEMEIVQDAREATARARQVTTTGLSMRMGALGVRGALLEQGVSGGMDLALKADALFVRTEWDPVSGETDTTADASRLRLLAEAARSFAVSETVTWRPSLEIGLRSDGGDAETGTGAEIGIGMTWSDAATGLSAEARMRTLLSHTDSNYGEWGMSASVRLDPGERGRGRWFSVTSDIGATASAAERLWAAQAGLGPASPDGTFEAARSLTAEAGYGMPVFGGRFTGTPNAGVGLADGGAREARVGWRLTSAMPDDPRLEFSLDAARSAPAGEGAPTGTLMLRGTIRW